MMSNYNEFKSEADICDFIAKNIKKMVTLFVLDFKQHSVSDDIIELIASYLIEPIICPVMYAIEHNLPYVLNSSLSDSYIFRYDNGEYAIELLSRSAQISTVDMFKMLYEHPICIREIFKSDTMYFLGGNGLSDEAKLKKLTRWMLDEAVEYSNLPVISYLVEEKNMSLVSAPNRWLGYETIAICNRDFNLCKYLIEKGADVQSMYNEAKESDQSFLEQYLDPEQIPDPEPEYGPMIEPALQMIIRVIKAVNPSLLNTLESM